MLSEMVLPIHEPRNICHMTGIDVVPKKIQVYFYFSMASIVKRYKISYFPHMLLKN